MSKMAPNMAVTNMEKAMAFASGASPKSDRKKERLEMEVARAVAGVWRRPSNEMAAGGRLRHGERWRQCRDGGTDMC
jgi:hypothetical protein